MPDCQLIGTAIGGVVGGVIGAGGTLGAVWLTGKSQREGREAAIKERWRDEAASVLGAIGTLLVDTHPTRLGVSADPEGSPKVLEDIQGRWQLLRDRLGVVEAGHPSADVSKLSHDLHVAVYNAVISARWHTHDVLSKSLNLDYYEKAKSDHAKAEELRQALLVKVRPT